MLARKHIGDILFVTAVLYMGTVVVSVLRHSCFIDDDYENFYFILHNSFWGYIFTLVDDQFVPLHRLFTYLIYTLMPLNFPFAVGVLLVLHLLAVWYLRDLLRLLGDSPVNKVLLFLYATNVYWFVPLMWWSSGIHRFSYVLLSVICLYHYLKYRDTSDRRHLLVSFAALVATFFIYTKAVLLPAYLLGLELGLRSCSPRPGLKKRLLALVPFFAVSLVHVVWYRIHVPEAFGHFTLDPQYLAAFVAQSFYFLSQGLFTAVYNSQNAVLNILLALFWVGLFTYSVMKEHSNVWIWLIGLALISLNFLLIATSPRNVFGLGNVLTHRYYFELAFLAVIFLKLIFHNIPAAQALSDLPRSARRLLSATPLQITLILAYASLSFVNCRTLMDTPRYARHDQARVYMANLSAGVARLKAAPPAHLSFMPGVVPGYVTGFKWKMRPYDIFLQLFHLKATFGVPTEDLYTITETGEIQKVE